MKQFLFIVKKETQKHLFDYLLFLTAGIFFLVGTYSFRGERLMEFIMLLFFASFYIIWGFYHHTVENSIHLKTVIEYILLGFTVLFLLKIIILPG